MSIACKFCNAELSNEFSGELPEGTMCPHCGEILRRNITVHLSGAVIGISGGIANLTVRTYPEGLLEEVADLIERDKFTLAVVVAQMACEISVERALTRAFDSKGVDEEIRNMITRMLTGRSITNPNVRKMYNTLTGKDVHKELEHLGIWKGLTNLAEWRNAAVHRGAIWTKTEADAALQTATALVQYFKQ